MLIAVDVKEVCHAPALKSEADWTGQRGLQALKNHTLDV